MRSSFLFFLLIITLTGCAVPASRWRESAFDRFNSALAAGSQQFAPEETDNIRQTLALADRYRSGDLPADAERLYQLSCQKSQLLYRNLVLSKIRQGATLHVADKVDGSPEEIVLAAAPVSIRAAVAELQRESSPIHTVAEATEMVNEPAVTATVPVSDTVPQPLEVTASTPADETLQRSPDIAPLPDATAANTPVAAPPAPPPSLKSVRTKTAGAVIKPDVPPVIRDAARSTTIYLTFDDGPSKLTLPIASFLNTQGVAATFFALGSNIKGHEKTIRETLALGHQVGNHTLSHDLHKLNGSLNQEVNEIGKTAALINRLGGDGKMVRIPYGAATKKLASTVAMEGGQIFDWDIDSHDSSSKRSAGDHRLIEQAVVQQLRKSSKKHIVLLFHDGAGHSATLTAIRRLIPRLKQEGYRFGLLSRTERVAQAKKGGRGLP